MSIMIFDLVSDLILVIGGILLPAYSTYKALRQKAPTNRLIWLRYWVVFGFYHAITSLTDFLLFWLPLYSSTKIMVLLWLASSKASGAQIVYSFAVVPLLKDRESVIDKKIEEVKKQMAVYFWTIITSTGINWSLIIATVLKSGVGIVSNGLENNSENGVQQVPHAVQGGDVVDGIYSEDDDMATDDVELVGEFEPSSPIQSTPPSSKPGKKNRRVSTARGRRVKDENESSSEERR